MKRRPMTAEARTARLLYIHEDLRKIQERFEQIEEGAKDSSFLSYVAACIHGVERLKAVTFSAIASARNAECIEDQKFSLIRRLQQSIIEQEKPQS